MEGITIFRVYILQKLTVKPNALNNSIIKPFFTTLAMKGNNSITTA